MANEVAIRDQFPIMKSRLEDARKSIVSIERGRFLPGKKDLMLWIGEVHYLCVSSAANSDADNASLRIQAYADRLKGFPAKVVCRVLKEWPMSNKFFPALAELIERIEEVDKRESSELASLKREVERLEDAVSPEGQERAERKALIDAQTEAWKARMVRLSDEHPDEDVMAIYERSKLETDEGADNDAESFS